MLCTNAINTSNTKRTQTETSKCSRQNGSQSVTITASLAYRFCAKRRRRGLMFCCCFIFKYFFCDFCHTNYLNIDRTDLYEICRTGRTLAVDERPEVSFSIPQGTLPWQPILWAKSTSNTHLVVRVTFAGAAPPPA